MTGDSTTNLTASREVAARSFNGYLMLLLMLLSMGWSGWSGTQLVASEGQ